MPSHFFVSYFPDPFLKTECGHKHRTREGALRCARARWRAAGDHVREFGFGKDARADSIARMPEQKLEKCVKGKHGKGRKSC